MRLMRAVAMDRFADEDDFGDREDRMERREDRRQRRKVRRRRRRSRRAERYHDKAERLEQGGRRVRRRSARARDEADEAPLERLPQGGRYQPAPMQPQAQPAWPPDLPAEPGEMPLQPMPDGFMDEDALPFEEEVMGLWPSLQARRWVRATQAALPPQEASWSPPARMGRHMRIQARAGYRAAIVELKPGLYMVAEVPEQATRPEFGVAPLLAPMMMKAAARVVTRRQAQAQQPQAQPQAAQPQRPGLLALLRHPQPQQPQAQSAPVQQRPVAQLPGPVAQPAQGQVLMPQPVQWAAVEDVSGFVGFFPLVR